MVPHESSSPIVRLKNVSLIRDRTILKGIDWEIAPGEHWAVLGANGCGKTSLLRLIARYQMASSGEVFVLNTDDEIQGIRKKIGLVSSHLAQMIEPLETGFEVVLSGAQAMINHWGIIDDDERKAAMRCLRQCGITRLADAQWGRLSQGERQRLLVARALMNPLQLLVLDEPCAGLDPAARENFLGLIQRIASRKNAPAIVLVTHHVEEIIEPFQKTLILSPKGKILAKGNTAQVLKAEALSEAFGAEVKITKCTGRYRLEVARREGASF